MAEATVKQGKRLQADTEESVGLVGAIDDAIQEGDYLDALQCVDDLLEVLERLRQQLIVLQD